MPAHHAAGLQQARRAKRRFADEKAWSEADAARELVGLRGERRADLDRRLAERDARSRREIEPRQQRRIGGGAESAIALLEQRREWLRRIERDRAVERIG